MSTPVEADEQARILAQRAGVHRLWAVYFIVSAVVGCVLVLVHPCGPRWHSWVAAAAMLVPVPAYHYLVGRWYSTDPAAHHGSWRGWLFAGGAVACLTFASVFSPWAIVGMFYVIGQLAIALPYLAGMGVVVGMNAAVLGVRVLLDGPGADVTRQTAIACLVTVAFSLVFSKPVDTMAQSNITNQRLVAELRTQRTELARLSRAEGAARERERFAREMHDTVTQGLASILTLSRAARAEMDDDPHEAGRHLDLIVDVASESLQESRAMITALGPHPLRSGTLSQAIERTARRLADETGLRVHVDAQELPPLTQAVQVAVLRICQESLANVRRHASAQVVEVRLCEQGDEVVLTVADDGAGFDPGSVGHDDAGKRDVETTGHNADEASPDDRGHGGYGLRDMRERASEIGGTLRVTSAPGRGCTVSLRVAVPVDAPEPTTTRLRSPDPAADAGMHPEQSRIIASPGTTR